MLGDVGKSYDAVVSFCEALMLQKVVAKRDREMPIPLSGCERSEREVILPRTTAGRRTTGLYYSLRGESAQLAHHRCWGGSGAPC